MTPVQIHDWYDSLVSKHRALEVQILATQSKLADLQAESALIEKTKVALEQCRPLLAASSIKQLEALANSALSSIFDIPGTIEFDIETKRFVLKDGDLVTDLTESNGGGLISVLSFVFDLYLLVKKGCRRLLVYDESFYAVSECYFPAFMEFVRKSCHDLGVDLLLVSHDARIDDSMVDHVFQISNHHSKKLK